MLSSKELEKTKQELQKKQELEMKELQKEMNLIEKKVQCKEQRTKVKQANEIMKQELIKKQEQEIREIVRTIQRAKEAEQEQKKKLKRERKSLRGPEARKEIEKALEAQSKMNNAGGFLLERLSFVGFPTSPHQPKQPVEVTSPQPITGTDNRRLELERKHAAEMLSMDEKLKQLQQEKHQSLQLYLDFDFEKRRLEKKQRLELEELDRELTQPNEEEQEATLVVQCEQTEPKEQSAEPETVVPSIPPRKKKQLRFQESEHEEPECRAQTSRHSQDSQRVMEYETRSSELGAPIIRRNDSMQAEAREAIHSRKQCSTDASQPRVPKQLCPAKTQTRGRKREDLLMQELTRELELKQIEKKMFNELEFQELIRQMEQEEEQEALERELQRELDRHIQEYEQQKQEVDEDSEAEESEAEAISVTSSSAHSSASSSSSTSSSSTSSTSTSSTSTASTSASHEQVTQEGNSLKPSSTATDVKESINERRKKRWNLSFTS